MICFYCNEPITDWDEVAPGNLWVDGEPTKTHRVCALRVVMGGIGHLENHYYWCKQMGDPDAGLSFLESAKRVDDWVRNRAAQPYEEED